jgi:hypothetical protein
VAVDEGAVVDVVADALGEGDSLALAAVHGGGDFGAVFGVQFDTP